MEPKQKNRTKPQKTGQNIEKTEAENHKRKTKKKTAGNSEGRDSLQRTHESCTWAGPTRDSLQ